MEIVIKKILITNHFLKDFTGSELAVYDLAIGFLKKEYIVTVAAFQIELPLKRLFEDIDVKLFYIKQLTDMHFDLIWAQHFTTLDTCLLDNRVTADKIIFSSLSPYEPLESLPVSIASVDLFLANSVETQKVLTETGLDGRKTQVFANPASQEFFESKYQARRSLKKIAVVSNHRPIEIIQAIEILRNSNIIVTVYGIGGDQFQRITADVLSGYDAVITIGRTVQYALAMGLPVYCYDRFGGPGWIMPSNIDLAAEYNFSGRCIGIKKEPDQIVIELIDSFLDVLEEIEIYSKYANEHSNLSYEIDNILENFFRIEDLSQSIFEPSLYEKIVKRQRKYYQSIANNSVLLSQLFIDCGDGYSEEKSTTIQVKKNKESQELCFNLKNAKNLKNLRLDPLNDSCEIEIESLRLLKEDGEIDLLSFIKTNACGHYDKSHLFDSVDPQIYFEGLSSDDLHGAQKLIAYIRYIHVGEEVLKIIVEQKENYISEQEGRERELRERLSTTQEEMRELEQNWNDKLLESNRLFEEKRQGFEQQSQLLQQAIEQAHVDKTALVMDMTEKERIRTQEQGERERELRKRLSTTQEEMREFLVLAHDWEKACIGLSLEIITIQQSFSWRITSPMRAIANWFSTNEEENTKIVSSNIQNITHVNANPLQSDDSNFKSELNTLSTEETMPSQSKNYSSITTLDEILALHDEDFVNAAYQQVLKRNPDSEGFQYYLGRIRKGISKIDVLGKLRNSSEGQKYPEPFVELDSTIQKYRRTKWPILGRLFDYKQMNFELIENRIYRHDRETKRQFDYLVTRMGKIENKIPYSLKEKIKNSVSSIENEKNSFTQEEYNLISNSSLFDIDYYLKNYPEISEAGIDPLAHFMEYGWKEKKNPSLEFDVCFYLVMNKDVLDAGINPLLHYCGNGKAEGRLINSSQNYDFIGSNRENYHNIAEAKEKDETFYKNYENKEAICLDIKAIAFYLPQFHPIVENDLNWGKGFTEWTNVTKANQNFVGHYQPQLPIDLGFYDLRIVDNIKRQATLAKNYGIYGFCFHHYWFDGKGVMRTPIDLLLEHKEIEINFCLNWANENWTRRWDGREEDILLKQNHSDADDLLFIQDASKYFRDSRYIRINSKPLLLIYRPSLFPDIKKTVLIWKKWCKENGLGDLYICLTDSFENINPESIDFDASVQFVPNTLPLESMEGSLQVTNPNFKGGIVSYDDAVEVIKKYTKPEFKKFRGICPAWDNTPRRQDTSYIVHNSTPEKYKNWLKIIIEDTFENFQEEERFIFINAWNEWAEGAHLEPDRKYGYAYLDATYAMLSELQEEKVKSIEKINKKFKKRNKSFFVIHAYYFDVWDEFEQYITLKKDKFDFFISVPSNITITDINKLANYNCIIKIVANVNRDLGPFLDFYNLLTDYDFGCKISLKKSSTEIVGDIWREQIFEELLSDHAIKNIYDLFQDKSTGMIIPESFLLDFKYNIASNQNEIIKLCNDFSIPFPQSKTSFSAGTMFWFRPKAMHQLRDFEIKNYYEPVKQDGTLLHAIERILGYLCEANGYITRSTKKNSYEGSEKSYFENILEKGNIVSISVDRVKKNIKSNLLIFVHYNKIVNKIDEYVFHYLKSLQELDVDIVFISHSYIDESYKNRLMGIVTKVILKKNIGYDFSAYKHGLSVSDFWNYEKVFLVNDTIYGPFSDFSKSWKTILNHRSDIVGLTASMQFGFHIQSYFICFDKKVVRTDAFREFWSFVKDETCIEDVIMSYEIKLTTFFTNKGYSANALFELDENTLMKNPISLMDQGYPFVKKRFIDSISELEKNNLIYYVENKFGNQIIEKLNKTDIGIELRL